MIVLLCGILSEYPCLGRKQTLKARRPREVGRAPEHPQLFRDPQEDAQAAHATVHQLRIFLVDAHLAGTL